MRYRNQAHRPLHLAVIFAGIFPVILGSTTPAGAQSVPTGFQEYFVIGYEQHVWEMLTRVQTGEGGPGFVAGMNSVVSATASADSQQIIYDHWEDGYEADIGNPVQPGTLIIGDGNTANGQACDFTTDPRIAPCDGIDDDVLFAGSFVNFDSDDGLGCAAPPNDLNCSVPVNPRLATDIRYDGGDRLLSSGGPISLIHPQDPLSPFIGGATEIISRQAVEAARSYSIPVGEDIYGGDGSLTEPFKYVDLNLIAFDDGTQVSVDSPGAGIVSFTLNRGEHYSSRGRIDGGPGPAITINAGTKVSTTAPLSGLIFTGGDGTFATRFYTLLPDILHSTDYIITAPGDDPALQGSRPLNLYLFNPDPINALDVTVTDSVGSATFNIPANSQVDYFTGTGRFVPTGSTVRMTSDRNFWGVSAYDHNTPANDWGHSWLARKFVTANYTISFAPGVNDPVTQSQPAQRLANDPDCTIPPAAPGLCDSINRSPVFVSTSLDNTQIQVDFNNDGVFDVIDLDGDDFPDPAPLPGNTYVINTLQSLRIYDHTDYDNTGTLVVANKPIAVAYGQDTDQATGPDPIQDTGYTIYPIDQLFLDPSLVIEKTADPTIVPISGGTVEYTLTVRSFDFGPLLSLEVYDLLPPGVAGSDYVPGSSLVTYPDLAQDFSDPSASIDAGTGRDRLDWTLSPNTLDANRTLTVRYSVDIPAAPGGTARLLVNEGHALATLGSSVFAPLDTARVVQADLSLTKTVDNLLPMAGDLLTFTLTVTNASLASETNVVVSDPLPSGTTFEPGSIVDAGPFTGVYDPAQNAVVFSAAVFAPGGPHALSFQARVDPGTSPGTMITNRAGYESTETPFFFSNQVEPEVIGPELVIAKTGTAGPLRPGDEVIYEITVDNVGSAPASNMQILDPFPANATYVAGSMEYRTNINPFIALTDAADADSGTAFVDRVELLVASLGAGEDLTFRFRVTVDPGTDGLFLNNQATVFADQVLPRDTNLVQAPIVGDRTIAGRVFLDLDGNGVQDPGEPGIPNVDVVVTDSAGSRRVVTDANGDYTATVARFCYEDRFNAFSYSGSDGSEDWTATPWVEIGTPAEVDQDPTLGMLRIEADPLGLFGLSLLIDGDPIADRGYTRLVDMSSFTQGTTILSFDYRRVSMEAPDNVTVEIDYDNNGTFDDTVLVSGAGTDAGWQTLNFTLDAGQLPTPDAVLRFFGTNFNFENDNFYIDNVEICNDGGITTNVDETDPDFPNGAMLTTANDPQTFDAGTGPTPVGYQPLPFTFTKESNSDAGIVSPSQILTYTLEGINNTGITQTGVTLSDPLPTGTLMVPGSTRIFIQTQAIRATEYYLAPGTFSGTTYDLTLDQALSADYFVIIQGSDGDGSGANNRGPDENFASLIADPFGSGQLAASTGSDVIRLQRGNAVNSWVGVVTVVECLANCDTVGFRLRDARRVLHNGAAASGADNAATGWTDINQAMLIGGFNGAGCDTAETDVNDMPVCFARIFPSGSDQINWTRLGGGGAVLSTATSTVLVVEWGSEWAVQRLRVTGANGGDGANAVGEYNTAALASPVIRDNTWVWGTGHTDDNGLGDSAEGVLITLGDGVNQNASENQVAVGLEAGGTNVDFEVYTLSHPGLAVDYRFKTDGDTGVIVFDLTVDAAMTNRFAVSYNGSGGTGTAFPRPLFSARYLNDTTVRLERRRSGQPFPAWVQGIDFSNLNSLSVQTGGDPPNLVTLAHGISLDPGQTITVTFDVRIDPDLAPGVVQITNTGTLTTDLEGPFNAQVTDNVLRLGVVVEPNNAGFAVPGGTVTYNHRVTNDGQRPDSYDLRIESELGWRVELIDPATGVVIATDSDGNGVWDGGVTVNTGTLTPNASIDYRVRITVPGGTPLDVQDSTTLFATSDTNPLLFDFATDETTTVATIGTGPVVLEPDHSGVVSPGGTIVYTHTILNNTGVADTFDLTAFPSQPGWTSRIYNDSNGDGVFTPGVDVEISNTLLLADGQQQTFFVEVEAPPGALPGDTDVTSLTAISRNDTSLFDAASDTTTVAPPQNLDLSGGGTLLVTAGGTAVFPGTLKNKTDTADEYDFTISASPFFGLDGLPHPTELWVDTNADGAPDTRIGEDSDGDGTWDFVDPAFDTNGDGNPDVMVAAGGDLAFEMRRPVDPAQGSYRDPVTLTATSRNTGERDSVTPTNLLAAATHALISDFRAISDGGRTVVEWQTALEVGTVGFRLLRERAGGRFEAVHQGVLPALQTAAQGGVYRFVDTAAEPGKERVYRLVEVDRRGVERHLGPFPVTVELAEPSPQPSPRGRGSQNSELGQGSGFESWPHPLRAPSSSRAAAEPPHPNPLPQGRRGGQKMGAVERLRVLVEGGGLVKVGADELAAAFGVDRLTVDAWLAVGDLRLMLDPRSEPLGQGPCPLLPPDPGGIFRDGFESGDVCAWSGFVGDFLAPDLPYLPVLGQGPLDGLYFYAEELDDLYAARNVYWLERRRGNVMTEVASAAVAGGLESFAETRRFETDALPATAVFTEPASPGSEPDFWFWDFLVTGSPTLATKSFTVEAPGAAPGAAGRLRLELHGQIDTADVDPDHRVVVRWGAIELGTVVWDGTAPTAAEFELAAGLIAAGPNQVEIEIEQVAGVDLDVIFLEAFELDYDRLYQAAGDVLEAPAEGRSTLTMEGFSRDDVEVFELGPAPSFARRVGDVAIADQGGGFRLAFASVPGRRYLALPLALATPAVLEVDLPSNLRDVANQAEYIVLAGPGLDAAAEDLAELRRSQGLTALTVRVQDVYDEWNRGLPSPWAIRDFLAHARDVWIVPPRFMVLAGDSSFDYRDLLGLGENLIPAPLRATPDGLFAADNLLGDLVGEDGVPEVALGRLPVHDAAQLGAYVAKLTAMESTGGAWQTTGLWVADDVDEGGEFVDDLESLAQLAPPSFTRRDVLVDELGADVARQELLSALGEGARIVTFLGHGGLDRLADEGLVVTADVAALGNGPRLPVLTALTCAVGRFDLPGFDTLSETLVRQADGGVAALWSPSGLSFNHEARDVGEAFLVAAYGGGQERLGDAVRTALVSYTASGQGDPALPYLFILLGDPAIRLTP